MPHVPLVRMLLLALPVCMSLTAQRRSDSDTDTLKFVLILARHGVRSPTKPNSVLNRYSVEPWPAWEVAPGELTPHGAQLLRVFGAYDRLLYSGAGLLPALACPAPETIFLIADTDHRTVESAHALAEGIAPGCSLAVHSLRQSADDPVFHYLASTPPSPTTSALAFAALQSRVQTTAKDNDPAFARLGQILNPNPKPTDPPYFLNEPQTVKPGKGDHLVDIAGPLATASMLSEVLLLEYADGKAADELGWGRLKAQDLPLLISLHTAYFDLVHRTPEIAHAEASNLLNRYSAYTAAGGGRNSHSRGPGTRRGTTRAAGRP